MFNVFVAKLQGRCDKISDIILAPAGLSVTSKLGWVYGSVSSHLSYICMHENVYIIEYNSFYI